MAIVALLVLLACQIAGVIGYFAYLDVRRWWRRRRSP